MPGDVDFPVDPGWPAFSTDGKHMVQTVTIAQLLRDGIVLTPDEAVAIAQKLIHDRHPVSAGPPFGPPSPDTVSIDEGGAVLCSGCDATPAVSELGILLEAMLPPGARAPGGLRYAIARTLLNVDAPPFDSVQDFSRVLARFENGDREAVIRNLFERWRAQESAAVIPFKATPAPPPPSVERRRPVPPALATELRRELRHADLERYRLHVELALRERRQASARTHKLRAIVAGFAAGLGLIATGELMHRRYAIGDAIVAPGRTRATSAPAAATEPAPRAPSMNPARVEPEARSAATNGSPVSASPRRRAARRRAAPGRVPVRAPVDAVSPDAHRTGRSQAQNTAGEGSPPDGPAATPAVESEGTAMFVSSGKPAPPNVLLGAGEELQVMTIADEDGAKNLHVQPSPDGRSVAFDSDRGGGERGIYLADRDGSHVRRVSGAGYAAMPSWSPDSRQLVYLRRDPSSQQASNLWLLSIDSGSQRRLTGYSAGQTWGASWFPDGRRVAYADEHALVILDVQSGRIQEFKSPIGGRAVRTPAVSPDGRRVVFQVDGHGAWLIDLKDGSMQCALTDPTAEQFAWTSDGTRFAFRSRRTGEWGMWVMARTI